MVAVSITDTPVATDIDDDRRVLEEEGQCFAEDARNLDALWEADGFERRRRVSGIRLLIDKVSDLCGQVREAEDLRSSACAHVMSGSWCRWVELALLAWRRLALGSRPCIGHDPGIARSNDVVGWYAEGVLCSCVVC